MVQSGNTNQRMRIFAAMILLSGFVLQSHDMVYCQSKPGTIDRKSLVSRHCPSVSKADSLSPFTVGNGEFAFTADVTGLQTFPGYYKNGIPLGTQSQWGWHSVPSDTRFTLDQTYKYHDTFGRMVPYASGQQGDAAAWLRANPHRLHLGRIGFRIPDKNGKDLILDESGVTKIQFNR